MKIKHILIPPCILLAACTTSAATKAQETAAPEILKQATGPIVQTRSTNYRTHDLAATTKFYTEYLGLTELFRSDIKAEKSRETYGVSGDAKITVVGFMPPAISKDQKGFAGLAFYAVGSEEDNQAARKGSASLSGQIVLAHRVQNLDEIERRMKAAGVPVVSPLSLSATGKSRSMTVVDPNGIRIETYEYVESK